MKKLTIRKLILFNSAACGATSYYLFAHGHYLSSFCCLCAAMLCVVWAMMEG